MKENTTLTLKLPRILEFNIGNRLISIHAFDSQEAKQNLDLNQGAVNIIASGPSIADLNLFTLLDVPTIFVNGSISLTQFHAFTTIAGYVISDANFITHRHQFLKKHYQGQPLYATPAVLEALATLQPDIMLKYHHSMRVIYPADRPWGVKTNPFLYDKLTIKAKILNKTTPLSCFSTHPYFVIDHDQSGSVIGASLDVTYGFIEAGTVAYVATQLAFSLQAGVIHLYGLDLLNNDQPRFYENSNHSAPSKLDKVLDDFIVPSFKLLVDVYRDKGVAVINHSPISKILFSDSE